MIPRIKRSSRKQYVCVRSVLLLNGGDLSLYDKVDAPNN